MVKTNTKSSVTNKAGKTWEDKKQDYRDEAAEENQEVVTPPELVERIFSFLSPEDFEGKDVLDPCVGPGALIQPILDDLKEGDGLGVKSLTVMDIQPMHVENFIKNIKAAKDEEEAKD